MAMALNIDRETSDPFYRYKMPVVSTKIEGRGNGIKTVLVNVAEIGRCVSKPPEHLTKFLSYELGAQCIIDEKNGKYIVNGAHERDKVQEYIYAFIGQFVLCKACRNPETVLFCRPSRKHVYVKCKACGFEAQARSANKLMKTLLKEAPEEAEVAARESGLRAKEEESFGSPDDYASFGV